jgi:hypothetical protein
MHLLYFTELEQIPSPPPPPPRVFRWAHCQTPSRSPFPHRSRSFISLDSFAFPERGLSVSFRPISSPLAANFSSPGPRFVCTRRMGTRDALLQIQMGTYANGVTCYYTFPYTNNVLIGPTPYVRRVRGAGTPVSPLLRRPLGPTDPRARARGKCGEDIRYARRGNRFIDRSTVSPLLPDRAKLECIDNWGPNGPQFSHGSPHASVSENGLHEIIELSVLQ